MAVGFVADMVPFLSFAVVTTFTPGPNNISSASMGVLYGYKRTFRYLLGITSGFFMVMMLCAFLSNTLLTVLPAAEQYLRWLGSAYIFWLAYSILKSGATKDDGQAELRAFSKGFALQLFNPKAIVYGLTIYTTFLVTLVGRVDYLTVSALGLAVNTFAAISMWALFGAAIRTKLQNDQFRFAVNAVLALLLAYTGLDLSGILA